MSLLLGCIADDHTGATDLGAMLGRAGLRVDLYFGVPAKPIETTGCDAVIIALKSRSIPAGEAVAQSLAALAALRAAGASRCFFKYCSTFDSTDAGNIGPVAEALADELGAQQVLFCPAFPENGRTVYAGRLFVHGKPLDESGMERHPLNPMTDSDLVRVLRRQSISPVGLLPYTAVEGGTAAVTAALRVTMAEGERFIIADAMKNEHLRTLGAAVREAPLVTGGSAIGMALAEALVAEIDLSAVTRDRFEAPSGAAAVIAGSCAEATRRQVAAMRESHPSLRIDPRRLASGKQTVEQAADWAAERLPAGPVLVYSTDEPSAVDTAHAELGREEACRLLEESLARIALLLVEKGVRRLVVAGGETSGAVTRALRVEAVRIGPEIAPGVPWVVTRSEPRLALALKSGNFGTDDFFRRALDRLP